jgi:hypothetical protein
MVRARGASPARDRAVDAVGELVLATHYKISELVEMMTGEECDSSQAAYKRIKRLLESNEIKFMRTGKKGRGRRIILLVPLSEIIAKLPELWKSIVTREQLKQTVRS